MSQSHVLIIGGTGLISTGIVKALLANKSKVTLFNRGKTENRLPSGVETIHGDRNTPAFEKTFAGQTYDAVIDMICFNPEQAHASLRAFTTGGGKTNHFIFCSTVCAYGNTQTDLPTHEGVTPRPHSGYGQNKRAAEKIFLEANAAGTLHTTVLRPSHTYGPGGSVLNNTGHGPDFIDRLRKGKPIIVYGDGHGLWQSAYCDDVGIGFAHACNRPATFGEVYNIVGQDFFTWDQYTQRVAHAIGAPAPRLIHIPTDTLLAIAPKRYGGLDSIFRYHGLYSNEKIQRDIPEYQPTTSLEEGTRATVAWMDAHKKIENSDLDTTDDTITESLQQFTNTLRQKLNKDH